MTNGNIVYARFPLDSDSRAPGDAVRISPMPSVLFSLSSFDILDCDVVRVGGNDGVFKNVVIVIARNSS